MRGLFECAVYSEGANYSRKYGMSSLHYYYVGENWILDEVFMNLLEKFQAELGRRILKVSRFHSRLSVLLDCPGHR